MAIPFYDSTREYRTRKQEFDSAVQSVMARGDFILGTEVAEFEQESVAFLDVKYAVGVASGSDALVLGADILGYRNDAEVLTPTFTFFSSTSCIALLGGKPVFVDMDEETLNMSLVDAERKMTPKTKGIIPVHLFQQPTPMADVMKMARDNKLSVLEDAAEAWGMESYIDGSWKKTGTIGDIGIYSFYPTKTLGAYGDAGLMVTNDERLYHKIKKYRAHGSIAKYQHDDIGYNSRLDTIQAAVLRVKLKTITENIAARARHADHYSERLKGIPYLRIPPVRSDAKPVHYVYNILVQNRDGLADRFREKNIGYSIYYPKPLHMQTCFKYLGYKKGDFPVSERISGEIIALPMYPELTSDEVDRVCDEIATFYK